MNPQWLTPHDVAALLQIGDLRTARRVMHELGAARVGRQLRLPATALDRLSDPDRIRSRPQPDHSSPTPLRPARRSDRDQVRPVLAPLTRDWLNGED